LANRKQPKQSETARLAWLQYHSATVTERQFHSHAQDTLTD